MKERIAVLGGGLGSLSAVHALTSEPGWADRYDITVYQMGWRLGGKAASHRTADGRIVEHGLHVWFGFYERAFRMIRDVYAELGRPPEHPLGTWEKAFSPYSLVVVHDRDDDGRIDPWPLDYPRNRGVPGDGFLVGPAELVRALVHWIRTTIEMAFRTGEAGRRRHVASRMIFGTVAGWLHTLDAVSIRRTRERLAALARRRREWKRLWVPLDLALTALYGIVKDDLLRKGFSAIDHLDLREWLASHGASRLALDSAPMRASYIAGFAYVDADMTRPSCAAGAMLQAALRLLFAYGGAYMWRMNAGMGEAVVAPIYEVLARRGVRFAFFHRVDELIPEDGRIAAIRMGRQAKPKPGWEPLVDVGGVPCWPGEPDWDALVDGDRLRERGAGALESNARPCPADPIVVRVGVDFDRVILGIPIGALPRITAKLRQEPLWAAALDHAETTATFSAQVWLEQPSASLRWPSNARSKELPLYGGAVGWVDTWADMSHLAACEGWSAESHSVHYLCGPWPDHAAAEPPLEAWLAAEARELWPGMRPDAVAATHVQVNREPSERYVLTPPGSIRHRLHPGRTGFDNLAVCGDWTANGVDLGCIEAAVASGLLCAEAVSATPTATYATSR
jgi:uncharacterized protein with NAD-binding domain and iron-sulfur cluster